MAFPDGIRNGQSEKFNIQMTKSAFSIRGCPVLVGKVDVELKYGLRQIISGYNLEVGQDCFKCDGTGKTTKGRKEKKNWYIVERKERDYEKT